jgi:hypothetical protein
MTVEVLKQKAFKRKVLKQKPKVEYQKITFVLESPLFFLLHFFSGLVLGWWMAVKNQEEIYHLFLKIIFFNFLAQFKNKYYDYDTSKCDIVS